MGGGGGLGGGSRVKWILGRAYHSGERGQGRPGGGLEEERLHFREIGKEPNKGHRKHRARTKRGRLHQRSNSKASVWAHGGVRYLGVVDGVCEGTVTLRSDTGRKEKCYSECRSAEVAALWRGCTILGLKSCRLTRDTNYQNCGGWDV